MQVLCYQAQVPGQRQLMRTLQAALVQVAIICPKAASH